MAADVRHWTFGSEQTSDMGSGTRDGLDCRLAGKNTPKINAEPSRIRRDGDRARAER
jgi:hypothetical protein